MHVFNATIAYLANSGMYFGFGQALAMHRVDEDLAPMEQQRRLRFYDFRNRKFNPNLYQVNPNLYQALLA